MAELYWKPHYKEADYIELEVYTVFSIIMLFFFYLGEM